MLKETKMIVYIFFSFFWLASLGAATFDDCNFSKELEAGDFGPVQFESVTWNGSLYYCVYPTTSQSISSFPLLTFMHGSTGQWEMYNETLLRVSSHGFVVVFPFIKSPKQDTHPWVTNTDGTYVIKAVEFAANITQNQSSSLYEKIDMSNVVLAGHSMGATDTIMAASKLEAGTVKAAIAMHPGLCGPLGPPPCFGIIGCNTWLETDLEKLTGKVPLFTTTATNDAAFRPAPNTAAQELVCFQSGMNGTGAFAQFSSDACAEDGDRDPFPDGGHNCPLKFSNGSSPEWPWVLTTAKLYGQQSGNPSSQCYSLLWGDAMDSLSSSPDIDFVELVN
jgi:dienelactone hydrolase